MNQEGSSPLGSPYLPQGNANSGNMLNMTNPERELKRLEANLRGQVLAKSGKMETRDGVEPLMNESGINTILGLVRSVVSRSTNMSNLSDQVLNGIMESVAQTLAEILMMNRISFKIRNDSDRTAIFNECVNRCHIAITRGWNGDDKRFWKGSVHEINYGMIGGQPNPTMMSQLNPKNWGGK